MSGIQTRDTMPKMGHVTDLREQWLVRADGALAHRLQDREISSHLCENRYRNQQIREDFPVALSEQRGIEHEVWLREQARRRQAELDADIAREMADLNLRRHRRHQLPEPQRPPPQSDSSARRPPPPAADPDARPPPPDVRPPPPDVDPDELGLSAAELEEMRRRLEQEEKDARLARQLSQQAEGQDDMLADMRCAVEAQDGELARLLQEREYKKLQRAKEKARQKALLKKQQRMAQHHELPQTPQATLCDAYSNPRDMIRESNMRLCKSVDSDLNYVEPFEKEQIQSKASALLSKEMSKQYYTPGSSSSNTNNFHVHTRSFDLDKSTASTSVHHRQPPPPPATGKKPRFPDPVSIRPASHYPTDGPNTDSPTTSMSHSVSENNNLYNASFQSEHSQSSHSFERSDPSKRLSVISDITPEGLAKKNSKQAAMQKKRRGCKIQ